MIQLDTLKGKTPVLRIARKVKLVGDEQDTTMQFGLLQDAPKTIAEVEYQLQGYMGPRGKSYPVLAQLVADPGQSLEGKDRPALRIYRFTDTEVLEFAVAFRHTSAAGKDYYTGNTVMGEKMNLVMFAIEPKEAEEVLGEQEQAPE